MLPSKARLSGAGSELTTTSLHSWPLHCYLLPLLPSCSGVDSGCTQCPSKTFTIPNTLSPALPSNFTCPSQLSTTSPSTLFSPPTQPRSALSVVEPSSPQRPRLPCSQNQPLSQRHYRNVKKHRPPVQLWGRFMLIDQKPDGISL